MSHDIPRAISHQPSGEAAQSKARIQKQTGSYQFCILDDMTDLTSSAACHQIHPSAVTWVQFNSLSFAACEKVTHWHGEVKKRVEFNLYLQDTARYEIPHRNKKPIERRSFIQYVQFGTVQVQFCCKKCYNNKPHLKRVLSRETVRQTYTKHSAQRTVLTSDAHLKAEGPSRAVLHLECVAFRGSFWHNVLIFLFL